MALRMAATESVAAAAGSRWMSRLFSSTNLNFPFNLPTNNQVEKPPPAEPNTNLFISGLNKRTTSEELREAFSKFGQVLHARVVTDRASGYSKGFGFVRYVTIEEAEAGIKGMDGQFLHGWVIFAEYARPRQPPLSPGNNVPPYSNQNSGPAYGQQ